MAKLSKKFSSAAKNTAMLVARIDNDRCVPITSRFAKKPQPTASIFKIWLLGALAQAITDGRVSASTMIPLSENEIVPVGSTITDVPLNTQFPLADMAALMMGRSDNTATDHIHELVGRGRIEKILKQFGNKNANLMTPFLSVNEQFHVLWSLTPQQANDYAGGTEEFQRDFLNNVIVPLGPVTSFPYANVDALRRSSWQASPLDICAAYAGLRKFDNRSEAFKLVDRAFSAETALLSVRNKWDRVWQKGGSFGGRDGSYVLTLSWMFESDDRGAFVVILMANNEDGSPVDSSSMFSIVSRTEEILFAKF